MNKRSLRSIHAIISDLTPGYVLSVGRPGSLFQRTLEREGWDSSRFESALPDCIALEELGSLGPFNTTMMPIPKYIVSDRKYQCIMNNGQDLDVNTIDDLFSSLKKCSAIEIRRCINVAGIMLGAINFIRKHKPFILVQVDSYNYQIILRTIKSFGYELYSEFSDDLTQNSEASNESVGFLAAIPVRTRSILDVIHSDRADRTRLNQPYFWKNLYLPSDFARGRGSVLETMYGRTVIWTGPHRKTLLQTWPPSKGFYSLVIECISESASSEIEEILIGGDCDKNIFSIERDGIILRVSRTVIVRQCDVENGFVFALVSKGITWRSVKNKGFKVGIPILSIQLTQL